MYYGSYAGNYSREYEAFIYLTVEGTDQERVRKSYSDWLRRLIAEFDYYTHPDNIAAE